MKNISKKLISLGICFGTVLTLAACGGGTKSGKSASKGKEVTMVVENADLDMYKEWFEEFKEKYKEEAIL